MSLNSLKKTSAILGFGTLLASASSSAANDGGIQFTKDKLKLTLNPSYGGRITELRYGDSDLLSLPQPSGNNFGSTFWLSPQSLWHWPPVPEHDHAPYAVTARDTDSITMSSAFGAGARVSKTISIESAHRVAMHYRIEAQKDFPEVAAWEITRVPNRGLAFAPVNSETVETVRGKISYTLGQSAIWLPLDDSTPLVEGKVIANGSEGWLAYAVDQLLYLKVYPPVAAEQMATNEGDIELYLSGESPYLELEVQSAARPLRQGEQLQWGVDWLIIPIPSAIDVKAESAALLAFARDQLNAFTSD